MAIRHADVRAFVMGIMQLTSGTRPSLIAVATSARLPPDEPVCIPRCCGPVSGGSEEARGQGTGTAQETGMRENFRKGNTGGSRSGEWRCLRIRRMP